MDVVKKDVHSVTDEWQGEMEAYDPLQRHLKGAAARRSLFIFALLDPLFGFPPTQSAPFPEAQIYTLFLPTFNLPATLSALNQLF